LDQLDSPNLLEKKKAKRRARTILYENAEALLYEQFGVEHNETEREGQHIVACPDLEKLADPLLFIWQLVSI